MSRLATLLAEAHGDAASVQHLSADELRVDHEVRRAWEIELPDDLHDELVARIEAFRPELEAEFDTRLDPCDAVAAIRYPPGAFYRTHRDRAEHPDRFGLHRRAVSIVIFVNTGAPAPAAAFGGGRLRLHETPELPDGVRDIRALAGSLVAFPSRQLHEVSPVESGTRLVVVAWLLEPAG